MEDIIYRKYEEYSACYILDLNRLKEFASNLLLTYSLSELDYQLNLQIVEKCYFNLRTDRIPDFTDKIKHNIQLGQTSGDISYLNYLQSKFSIADDLSEVDLTTWNYQPKKIKIKLKNNVNLSSVSIWNVSSQLANLLDIDSTQSFKLRSDIVKLVHKYIYDNQFQSTKDKKCIQLDSYLQQVVKLPLGETQCTYENLSQSLDEHIHNN